MRRFLILAAVSAITMAKPELYKEQEDFQYSRSSTDEGSKSGFYDAQRGNMGGNYEKAHNMDALAQHQMGGLVNQVEGELGDGAKTRTGSVYSAANSRGVYGSGHYDLSNLKGRNFQEGATFSDSQSQSQSSAYNAAAYTDTHSSSRYGANHGAAHSGQTWQSSDLQNLDNSQAAGSYDSGHQSSSGYHSKSGYRSHSTYGSASDANSHTGDYGSNVQTRLVSAVPVRIVVRPGTRVAIPIGAQTYFNQDSSSYDANQKSSGYDTSQRSSVYDANQRSSTYDASQRSSVYDASQRSSAYDQSAVNSEAEALSDVSRHNSNKPNSDAKHYQSSYRYHKKWEKHDTIPAIIITPTENPFPQNSELYEDSQTRNHQYGAVASDFQRAHSSNAYSGYNADVKSSGSQSRYTSDLNSQQQSLSSASNLDAYTQGAGYNAANTDLDSQVENINSKPKSYHSSYAYHKSWERQGDPYVIQPASNGYNEGQSSQRLSAGTKSGSYRSGSHHQSQVDCDEICGHARVARSYDASQYQESNQAYEGQQQSQNLEDFGQQQSQNLEDLGQQQSQNLEDFGQQQSQNLEDFGQQLSQNLDNFGQQSQTVWEKYEDLGQSAQNKWDQQENQNTWDRVEDLGQQTQHNPVQNTQDTWNKPETRPKNVNEQTQNNWDLGETTEIDQQMAQQHNQDIHSQSGHKLQQQEQTSLNSQEGYSQSSHNDNEDANSHPVVTIWDKLYTGSMHSDNLNTQEHHFRSDLEEKTQNEQQQHQAHHSWSNFDDIHEQETHGLNTQTHFQPIWNQFAEDQNSNSGNPKLYPHDSSYHVPSPANNINREIQTANAHNWNVESTSYTHNNWHKLTTHDDSYTHNHQSNSQVNSGISNFWNKLDDIEKELEASSNKSSSDKYNSSRDHTNSENSYQHSTHDQTITTEGRMTTTYHNNFVPQLGNLPSINTYDKNENNFNRDLPTASHDIVRPQDIGRGDIGPEDLSAQSDTDLTDETLHNSDSYNKPITPLVSGFWKPQIHMNNNTSLDQQNSENIDTDLSRDSIISTTVSYNQNMDNKVAHDESLQHKEQKIIVLGKHIESFDKQNVDSLGQTTEVKENTDVVQDQSSDRIEQTVRDLGQENENLNQQNIQNLGRQNQYLEQQNIPDFRQQNENLEQQNVQDFGQQNENLEQQNIQDFGQQNENLDQQNIQDFGQQNQYLEQQNIPDFGQQNKNLEQQNVQDFGEQNENLEQQNIQDFGQQNENLDQQNIQDFGQQNENLEQQNIQDFGQHENLEHENIQSFGQQNENLEQQNLQDFGQHENLEQENIQDFGQLNENLEQQNIQDFVQQNENLEQQNMQNFGQENENLEQENIQDLGQQSVNLAQQNIQDFGQHNKNLQEQNKLDLGNPWRYVDQNVRTLDQRNTQHYQQQDKEKEQQKDLKPVENVGQEVETDLRQTPEKSEVIAAQGDNKLESTPSKVSEIESPQEPVTEKPGFWKSVGNKFVSAKDKVWSWFGS